MLSHLRTPAQQRRNLEDRLGRLPSTRPAVKAGSRTEARSPEAEAPRVADSGRRAAEKILNAGGREVDVGPEARRAANFILSAEDPDDDVEEAVDMIKRAGRKRDAREDEGEDEE